MLHCTSKEWPNQNFLRNKALSSELHSQLQREGLSSDIKLHSTKCSQSSRQLHSLLSITLHYSSWLHWPFIMKEHKNSNNSFLGFRSKVQILNSLHAQQQTLFCIGCKHMEYTAKHIMPRNKWCIATYKFTDCALHITRSKKAAFSKKSSHRISETLINYISKVKNVMHAAIQTNILSAWWPTQANKTQNK